MLLYIYIHITIKFIPFVLFAMFDMFGLSPFQGLFDRELMLRLDGVVGVAQLASKTHSLHGIEPRHHVNIPSGNLT